jgi:hypothetical protein
MVVVFYVLMLEPHTLREYCSGQHQRIWINNKSPGSTFCRWKLLQYVSGGGETAGGWGVISSSRGRERTDSTQGERIWSSLGRQKVERGLLLIIHILWAAHIVYTYPLHARKSRVTCDGMSCPELWYSNMQISIFGDH